MVLYGKPYRVTVMCIERVVDLDTQEANFISFYLTVKSMPDVTAKLTGHFISEKLNSRSFI